MGVYDRLIDSSDQQPKEQMEEVTPEATKVPIYQGTNLPRYQSTKKRTSKESVIDIIRRALLQENKESTNCRLSPSEKESLGDVLYSLKKRGLKSSEVEVVRVAINWLLNDYNERDDESILVKVLESKLV